MRNIVWSDDFAYCTGLIATDGNLSKDGRHITFVSKDLEQIQNLKYILCLKNRIGIKKGSFSSEKIYYYLQFSSVKLYRFLTSIGIYPNKSKSINKVMVPDKYFPDFLRGHLDGDGFTYSYWDIRWKNSYMLYTGFCSASKNHLIWLNNSIRKLFKAKGVIKYSGKSTFQLLFAKESSIILLKRIYYKDNLICLKRKWFKIQKSLGIISKQAGMLELVDRHA